MPADATDRDDRSRYARHVNPVLARFLALTGRDQVFVHAQGTTLTTAAGERYADWVAGFGSANLGHNHPRLIADLTAHLSTSAPNLYPELVNPWAGRLAEQLVSAAGAGFATAFLSNSGSEAVEAALKLARAATGRRTIVCCDGAYHGTTLGALSLMEPGPFRDPFAPLLADVVRISAGDAEALGHVLAEMPVAAVVLEPVQVESGVRPLPPGFLALAAARCRAAGALLVLDEAQTGMGRTGTLFAYEQEGAAPDILVVAKALGGGLMPIGATLARKGLTERAYGDYRSAEAHHSTFGGNALACRAALTALELICDAGFLATVRATAGVLAAELAPLKDHPLVERLTCRGLLCGLTLRPLSHPWFSWPDLGIPELAGQPLGGPLLVHRLHRRGILTQVCGHDWSTLRIQPPLIVTPEACCGFAIAVREELAWMLAQQ